MNTSVSLLLGSAPRFQQRFAPPRNATLGCARQGEEAGEASRTAKPGWNGGRLLHRHCSRSSTQNPPRGHRSPGPRFCPRDSLSADPEARSSTALTGPRRRPLPQRRRRPMWWKRRRRSPGVAATAAPAGPSCQARAAPPKPGPAGRRAATTPPSDPPRGPGAPSGFLPGDLPSPARPRPPQRTGLGTRLLLSGPSPSPSSKPGRHPDLDGPHRLPQVPPSGLRGEGAGRCLRLSPPWGPPAPPGLGTVPGARE